MKKLIHLLIFLPLFTQGQIINTIIGTGAPGHTGDGGMAATATIYNPNFVVFDAAGNMYIADEDNYCVRKVEPSGIISTCAGTGTPGYNGDGAAATLATLNSVPGIAIDRAGNLYIADVANERVRKVNSAGIISTFAGNGIPIHSGDGGPADSASIDGPNQVAVDDSGNVYISEDGYNCIRKVNTAGIISTIAGNGSSGYSGDGIPATAATISQPTGVVADTKGNVYIMDEGNFRIRKVDSAGIISTIAGNGFSGFSGDDGPATAATFGGAAQNLSLDSFGNLYFGDVGNNMIRKIDLSTGIISRVAGNDTLGFSGDGGIDTLCELDFPGGIGFDHSGNGYVADYYNNRIRKISNLLGLNVDKLSAPIEDFKVYPNPAAGLVNITSAIIINKVLITDMAGKVVFLDSYKDNVVQLNILNIPTGLYLLQINGSIIRKLVIE